MEFLRDLWEYMLARRKIWLAPLVIILVMMGLIMAIGAGSALAPFIYSLF
ncbi:MAG: DUF5989 family protein [Bacteroidia bacterium]